MSGKFFQALRELRAGTSLDELDSALAEVVAAVKVTHKPGKLIFTMTIRPPRKGTGKYLSIDDDIVTKVPKQDKSDTIFFPMPDNSLSRQDPDQMQLGLRPVQTPVPPNVDPATGEIRGRA